MMKIVIVEDEFYTQKAIVALLEKLPFQHQIVGICGSVKDALIVIKDQQPDLVLLDINLPDGDAFDLLEKTCDQPFNIIFITAYDDFAVRAIKKGAIDYILKPIVPEDFEMAISKAFESYLDDLKKASLTQTSGSQSKDKLLLGFTDCIQVISFRELMYCMSDEGYTTFFLKGGKTFLSSRPLKEFEDQLPAENFIRTHQSYILNLDYVTKYLKEGFCILDDDQKVPISVRRKKLFLTKFKEYGKYLITHS